jgi:lipoyl synthase
MDAVTAPSRSAVFVRWLGRVTYDDAIELQAEAAARAARGEGETLLLLEHEPVITLGRNADAADVLLSRERLAELGIAVRDSNRGGKVTYHGPGQLVGYPILTVANKLDAAGHVRNVEQVVIDTLAAFSISAGRLHEYPGVWVDAEGPNPRKICAIGVRLKGGRTMHGFALNVATDMTYLRQHIVACGIDERPVTSLREEGIDADLHDVVDVLTRIAGQRWGSGRMERQDVAWRHRPEDLSLFSRGAGPGVAVRPDGHREPVRMRSRLAEAGVVDGLSITTRKPDWLRPKVHHSAAVLDLRRTIRSLGLVTVCEDAGCPNLSECWADGTATFMVLGDRCTRACGFCLVDTRKPQPPAADEPDRVAEAIDRMGVDHAVLTMVARDDLPDGGMAHIAACVDAIRTRRADVTVETLISDARGDATSLATLFAARPDVMNHNVETVARLQRAVRPSAGYARSLSVLARGKAAGLATKSGFMVGLGETDAEIEGLLADLAAVGVDIVTIGQYLRPTSHHIPVDRWVEPARFGEWAALGESLGIGHVEASPLTRSSYHAKAAAAEVRVNAPVPATMAP